MSYNQHKYFFEKCHTYHLGRENACRIKYKCQKFKHLKLNAKQKLIYSWNYSMCILILTPLRIFVALF